MSSKFHNAKSNSANGTFARLDISSSRLRKCSNPSQKIIHLDVILQLCNINTRVCSPVKNHYHLWDLS